MNANVRDAVRAARLAYVFNGQPASLLVASALALLTSLVLLPHSSPWRVSLWCVVFIGVAVARRMLHRRYFEAAARRDVDLEYYERWFQVGVSASGVLWGSLCLVMFPRDAALQVFLGFVLSGVAAGAVTSLSALRGAAYTFVLCAVVPLGVRLMMRGDLLGVSMGLMVIAFLIVVSGSIRRLHGQLAELVTARAEADANLAKLQGAQADVSALNERLTIATQAAQLGVWDWNVRSGQLVWDARMYEMYSVAPDDTLSYDMHRQRIHPHDIARMERSLQAIRKSGDEFDEQFRVLWPNGEERYLRASARVKRDADGRVSRIVGVNWDVTDIKRLERLKNEFVSIVSHELRTPLTSIRGSLGLVAGGAAGELSPKALNLVSMADRNAERLAALIDDLLDMDKIESGKLALTPTAQPLMPIIEQAMETNAGYAHLRKVSYQLASRREVLVNVDALRLLQVLTNLLSNAAKFSPAGCAVMISVLSCERGVRIEVRDCGPGVSAEFAQRIFNKFAQADSSDTRAKGGTGLGLAISRALIEQMQGSIGYHSEPGAGATFFVELPEAQAAHASAA